MKKEIPVLRLQKYIADCGVTSRRKAEIIISEGRVKVNGKVVTELGIKIDPNEDVIEVDNASISVESVDKVYIVLNKPRGVMCTLSDPEGRETVLDFIGEIVERVYPVGRLDFLSEGLIILTNDGELTNMIAHPSNEVEKVYEVKVFGIVTPEVLRNLRAGVKDRGDFLKPTTVRIVKKLPGKTWVEFRLCEGKNREIRRICEMKGLTIDKLRRVAIGGLSIEGIPVGKYRRFTKKHLLELINAQGAFSAKRTLKPATKIRQGKRTADDRLFKIFRKDNYYTTLKGLEEKKKKLEEDQD